MEKQIIIHDQLKGVIFDAQNKLLKKEQTDQIDQNVKAQRYNFPAVTKKCVHKFACFEMQEALNKIQQQQQYKCPHCNENAKCPNDLVEDWRVQAYKEFNELVDEVLIIKGIMCNKYIRNKIKYLDFFTKDFKEEYLKQFSLMFDRCSDDNSINQLIQKDLQQQNQNKQVKINFWSFCLQDRVKINIPVRILGCKHYECYELTSLLCYQEQNRKKKEYLDCNQPGCSNQLKIAHRDYQKQTETPNQTEEQNKILDIQTLFSLICVDLDLFNAIKKSNPTSYKFYFNYETKQIQEDLNSSGDKYIKFIKQFYEEHADLQSKIGYQEFQKEIQQSIMQVSQGDLLQEDKQLAKQIALYKYRNYKVQMKDQLTQLPIEYPVRCKLCTKLEVCMDIRSYIADFIYQKKINQKAIYNCPLCKKQQNKQMYQVQIYNYIYLDSNMLSYMFKDMSYTNGTNLFEYQGEQYMLQEFMDRQKIKREVYIASLQEKQVKFTKLFCILNPNLKIKYPLILQNCDEKNMIDFKSFYEELKKIDFDYESKGLIFCKCKSCNSNPIKTLIGNIYFHEAFYEALTKFYNKKDMINDIEFAYKFGDNEQESKVIEKTVPTNNSKIKLIQPINGKEDASNLKLLKGEDGFLDLMNDDEYQMLFKTTNIEGYAYNAQQMTQNIGVVEIQYKKNGIYADVQGAVEKINKNANQDLKKFQFSVVGMQVQLNNEVFKQSKGEFTYQQQQQNK